MLSRMARRAGRAPTTSPMTTISTSPSNQVTAGTVPSWMMPPLAALIAVPAIYAQDMGEFTVGQIEVVGLQRISEGTVFNYLPVNIGDRMTPQKTEEALRALYSTGFF